MQISKKRRKEIKAAVIAVLNNCDKITLPVNIKHIVKCQKNVKLIPYSVQMKRRGFSKEDMLIFSGSRDGFTDYNHNTGQYIAYYNDTDSSLINTKRYRWTIAHELGHITLKHHLYSDKTRVFRSSLSSEEYNIFEEEADYFAALILVPHIVLAHSKRIVDTKWKLASMCNISQYASTMRFADYQKWQNNRNPNSRYDKEILNLFSRFMYKRKCGNCQNSMIYQRINHCIYCGSTDLKWTGDGKMIYDKFIFTECPQCKNEEINENDNFCMICKENLQNYCTNNDCENYYLSIPLPKNARYCPYCGTETSFFQKKLIQAWNYEPEVDDSINTSNFIPASFILEDDDLPF